MLKRSMVSTLKRATVIDSRTDPALKSAGLTTLRASPMNRAQATILYRAKIRIVIAGFGALHMARGKDDMKEIKIERGLESSCLRKNR